MRLIHQDATSDALRLLWSWVFGIWLVIILLDPIQVLSELPASVFRPAGILFWFVPKDLYPLLLQPAFLYTLKTLTAACLGLVLWRKWIKPAGLIACILLTAYEGIVRGFGYVDHAEIILLFAAYVLVLFSLAGKARPSAYFVTILTFLLFSYAFTGVWRLAYIGWDLHRPDLLQSWVIQDTRMLHQLFFSWKLDHLLFEHRWFFEVLAIGFPIQLMVEVLAPFCLISRQWRYLFLAVMIPFHILSWMFFKILFWENLLLYPLLIDWSGSLTFKKGINP